jgi:hypothetical protein
LPVLSVAFKEDGTWRGGGYLLTVYNLLIWLVFLTTQIPWLGFEVKKGVSKEKNAHFLISKQGFFR